MKKSFLMVLILFPTLLISSCAAPTQTTDVSAIITAAAATAFVRLSQTPVIATQTIDPTVDVFPTEIPTQTLQPTAFPTLVPIAGVMKANANIRSQPQKSKESDIGGILAGRAVEVIARNAEATWLYINYPESPTGKGWVVINAVTLNGELGLLPIIIFPDGNYNTPQLLPPFVFRITGTPLPPVDPPLEEKKFGVLLQPGNVRIGPSIGFLSIGILSTGQKVTFKGRIQDNYWVQIDYPSGPEGKGWILSSLLQANDGYSGLPYFDILGTPVTQAPVSSTSAPAGTSNPAVGPTSTADLSNTNPASTPEPTQVQHTGFTVQAIVTNQINVRSGPAQAFNSFGVINPNEPVMVTGITLNSLWYRIEYQNGDGGIGWVSSKYVKITGAYTRLPIYNDLGTQVPN
ncbi:MAG: SH3 domain-containing protein [Chloroflexota bacterium]